MKSRMGSGRNEHKGYKYFDFMAL